MSSVPYQPEQSAQRDVVYVVGNVLGVVSILFGCLGALVSMIPLLGVIALPFCVAGLFFAVSGLIVLWIGKRGSVKFPVIGGLLSIAAVIFCIVVNVVFISHAQIH